MDNNVLSEISAIKSKGSAARRKVAFVSGTFNILHPGHLRLLRFAKDCSDILVVGIFADEMVQLSTLVPEAIRLEMVQAFDWIDYAFIVEDNIGSVVEQIKPDFVVKGKEHEEADNPEQQVLQAYGGKLIFSSGEMSFSYSEHLLQDRSNHWCIDPPQDYLQRHQINLKDCSGLVERFSELSVVIIGDTILDEYIHCKPLGMSQEDPTLVVAPIENDLFLGGAAIVAGHAKSMGARNVKYFSVIGDDERAETVEQLSIEYGLESYFFRDDSRPTTLKQRYRAGNKTLLRVNHLRQHQISRAIQKQVLSQITEALDTADLLIFSDFNYGVLPNALLRQITKLCQSKNIMMAADSQSSSQTGDISRFIDMKIVTPTEHEARISLKNNTDGLVILAEKLRKKNRAEHIMLTMGEDGVLIHAGVEGGKSFVTDKLPAFNQSATDNSGAGDCMLVTAAMAMVAGADIWQSAYLGSLAAACQVGRIGNKPLTASEIQSLLAVSPE